MVFSQNFSAKCFKITYTMAMDVNQKLNQQDQLKELYQRLEADAPNLPLAKRATDIVPGEGPATAEVMFIGEAPGYHEAVQRRPFVGRSGQFFRQTLNDLDIDDQGVYISNVVKARPPDNRDPTPAELAAYKPYLDAEIKIIKPVLIVTLGRFSMAKFLPEVRVSQVHGRLHKVRWNGATTFVLPMYHPAAGLRNPSVKQAFIADFAKIPKAVDWIKSKQAELQFADTIRETLL